MVTLVSSNAPAESRSARKAARRTRRRQVRNAQLLKLHRRYVVVDAENAVRGAHILADHVRWARQALIDLIDLETSDQVVIATSHMGAVEVGVNWPAARHLVRSGADGADLALLDVLAAEHIADRFTEVVLVSGDGIFADVIAQLAAKGVHTTVVAHSRGLSRRLRLAASAVIYLPNDPPPTPAVAVAA